MGRALLVGLGLALHACGGDTVSPDPATVSGTVLLQDAWGNFPNDFSGIDVAVDGFATHATTDKSGAWHIDGAPAGQRALTFTKAPYATMRIPNQTVKSPSTTVDIVTMGQAPFQQAVIDSIHVVTVAGRETFLVDGHLSAPPPANAKFGAVYAVFGGSSAVSSDPATYLLYGNGLDFTGKLSTFSISLPGANVRSIFGLAGQAYVTVFATSPACGCYTDPKTQRTVYTTAGPRGNVVLMTIK